MNYLCKDYDCRWEWLGISISNLYFSDHIDLYIANTYNEKNVNNLLGINKDNTNYGSIFVNPTDFNNMFNKDSYQASVFTKHVNDVDLVSNELDKLGYSTLQIRKTLDNMLGEAVKAIKIIKLVVTAAKPTAIKSIANNILFFFFIALHLYYKF